MDRDQNAQAAGPRNEAKEMLLAMRDRIDSVHAAITGLASAREQDPLDRADPILPALFNLHDAVFRHAIAVEAGDAAPTAFVFDLLRLLEGELESIGVDVIRPIAGEEPDHAVMRASSAIETPWWRVPGQICKVETCGFITEREGRRRVLRKASVVVYRRRD